jgi:hypothetical protein
MALPEWSNLFVQLLWSGAKIVERHNSKEKKRREKDDPFVLAAAWDEEPP